MFSCGGVCVDRVCVVVVENVLIGCVGCLAMTCRVIGGSILDEVVGLLVCHRCDRPDGRTTAGVQSWCRKDQVLLGRVAAVGRVGDGVRRGIRRGIKSDVRRGIVE